MTPPLLNRFTLSVWTVFYGPKSRHLSHEMFMATKTDQRELGLLKIVSPMHGQQFYGKDTSSN